VKYQALFWLLQTQGWIIGCPCLREWRIREIESSVLWAGVEGMAGYCRKEHTEGMPN